MLWAVGSSVAVWPHSLAYFNELAGGPRGGHMHLGLLSTDTNLDCGQNLLLLRWWFDEHPHLKDVRMKVVQPLPSETLGFFCEQPPGPAADPATVQVDDTFRRYGPRYRSRLGRGHSLAGNVRSVIVLWHPWAEFAYFRKLEPVACIGHTLYVYHIDLPTANRLRRELGLEPLPTTRRLRQ